MSTLTPVSTSENRISRYTIIEGATPKLTISASESSCFPKSDTEFNIRAKKPSIKSKNAAIIIKNPATTIISLCKEYTIEIHPEISPKHVNKLGITFFNTFISGLFYY